MTHDVSPSPPGGTRGTGLWAAEEWPTVLLFLGCAGIWISALMLPSGWGGVSFVLLVLSLTLHSSLSHEILHGHPFRNPTASTALGLFQPGLFVPFLRFKDLHLAHHYDECLTDPYDDPESNYLDPLHWEQMGRPAQLLALFNNTLLGRMVLGPLIGMVSFIRADIQLIASGQGRLAWHWALHLPGVIATLWLVSLSAVPLWLYVLACYAAMSVLKIRTFAEHRAHERASARTVVIEDQGLLGLLFLFNNYHVVHHMHPKVCWYKLPALYAAQKERFLARNQGYVFKSYKEIFRSYFVAAKDPVPHPLWRGRRR